MSAALQPHHRTYELPWTGDAAAETAFHRLWIGFLVVALLVGALVTFTELPERATDVAPSMPPRLAKIVIEREVPPPPPPPPAPEVERPREEIRPPAEPRARPEQARERAARAGLLALQDELADLRQQFEDNRDQLIAVQDTLTAEGPARAERALITSRAGLASGGIDSAPRSRGFGGPAGSVGAHATTQVSTPPSAAPGEGAVRRTGTSGRGSRSREEIELVFDRNKGAIYALYTRALRERPDLQGKLVLEFTIAPNGEVTMCRVVSSDLADPELERRIVARVRMFRFEPREVEAVTTTKPIDFFPA
jgi:periplasmic protein TonB